MLHDELKLTTKSYISLIEFLSNPYCAKFLNPKQKLFFLKSLTSIIETNNKLLIKLMMLSDEDLLINKDIELIITKQNSKLEKLCKKIILWINQIIYKDYYRMNEVEEHCGISWRNIERYSKKGYIERIKIGNEIKIPFKQAQKALFILNCKNLLNIQNKTAIKIYENETERQYYQAKILQKIQNT